MLDNRLSKRLLFMFGAVFPSLMLFPVPLYFFQLYGWAIVIWSTALWGLSGGLGGAGWSTLVLLGVILYKSVFRLPYLLGFTLYFATGIVLGYCIDQLRRQKIALAALNGSLKASEARFRHVVEQSPLAVCLVSKDGYLELINKIALELFGFKEKLAAGQLNIFQYFEEYGLKKRLEQLRNGESVNFEASFNKQSNGKKEFKIYGSAVYDNSGQIDNYLLIAEDITYYKQIITTAPYPTMVSTSDGKILQLNKAWIKLTGYDPAETPTVTELANLVFSSSIEEQQRFCQCVLESIDGCENEEFCITTRAGDKLIWQFNFSKINRQTDGEPLIICMAVDITDRKAIEERALYLSMHDALTGLYNRNYFEEEIRRIDSARLRPISILICDLDNLKWVNDNFGHDIGDMMIRETALLLTRSFRQSDVVARIGGDEFAVIMPQTDYETAARITTRIREAVDEYNNQLENNFEICLSLGFATSNTVADLLNETFKKADASMYKEKMKHKRHCGNSLQELSAALEQPVDKDEALDNALKRVGELEQKIRQVRFLSTHDPLTGMFNRVYYERLLAALREDRRYYPLTVVLLDIDDLKNINRTTGWQQGDKVLKCVATILRKTFHSNHLIARTGGDEFIAILPHTLKAKGEQLAIKLEDLMDEAKDHLDIDQLFSFSLGVGFADGQDKLIDDALREAELMLEDRKGAKGAGVRGAVIKSLLAALSAKDTVTEEHSHRLQDLAGVLGEQVGLSKREQSLLMAVSMVHDLGKVGIPDQILLKPGPLTKEERAIMERHVEIGYKIALASGELAALANYILYHHEWWNGQGYPFGLKGEQIPRICRLLAIIDAFDAMTNDRPYRKAMSYMEAISELRAFAGKQFDPELVEGFAKVILGDNSLPEQHLHH